MTALFTVESLKADWAEASHPVRHILYDLGAALEAAEKLPEATYTFAARDAKEQERREVVGHISEKMRHAYFAALRVPFFVWEDSGEFARYVDNIRYDDKSALAAMRKIVKVAKREATENLCGRKGCDATAWEEWVSRIYATALSRWSVQPLSAAVREELLWCHAPPGQSAQEREADRWPYGVWSNGTSDIVFDRGYSAMWSRTKESGDWQFKTISRFSYDGAGKMDGDREGCEMYGVHDIRRYMRPKKATECYFADAGDDVPHTAIRAAFFAGKPMGRFLKIQEAA